MYEITDQALLIMTSATNSEHVKKQTEECERVRLIQGIYEAK